MRAHPRDSGKVSSVQVSTSRKIKLLKARSVYKAEKRDESFLRSHPPIKREEPVRLTCRSIRSNSRLTNFSCSPLFRCILLTECPFFVLESARRKHEISSARAGRTVSSRRRTFCLAEIAPRKGRKKFKRKIREIKGSGSATVVTTIVGQGQEIQFHPQLR